MNRVICAAGFVALICGNASAGTTYTQLAYTSVGDSNPTYGQLSVLGEWSNQFGTVTNFPTGIPPVTAFATAGAPGTAMSSLVDPAVGTGSASATMLLPLGILETDATAGGTAPGDMGAGAQASYSDTLSWQIANANAQSVNFVNFSFELDGTQSLTGNAHGTTSMTIMFGNAHFLESIFDGPSNQIGGNCNFGSTTTPCMSFGPPTNWASSGFIANTPSLIIFNATYELDGASGTLPIYFNLSDSVQSLGGTLDMDYSHTATVGLTGPAGFSFTTNSGTFLTGPSSAVPEPATCGAIAAALGVLVWIGRKGRYMRGPRYHEPNGSQAHRLRRSDETGNRMASTAVT